MFSEACNLQGVCIVGESGEGGMDKERGRPISFATDSFVLVFVLFNLRRERGALIRTAGSRMALWEVVVRGLEEDQIHR